MVTLYYDYMFIFKGNIRIEFNGISEESMVMGTAITSVAPFTNMD